MDDPQWQLQAGSTQSLILNISEVLQNDLGSCDHVEGVLRIDSTLGLTDDQMGHLDLGHDDEVYQDTKERIEKSIGVGDDADIEKLRRCTSVLPADQETRHCALTAAHYENHAVENFKDIYECEDQDRPGYLPLEEDCPAEWETRVQEEDSGYRDWFKLEWYEHTQRSLTAEERAAWDLVGINTTTWVGGGMWSTWSDFSDDVMTQVPTWADLDASITANLSEALSFTEETWGRLWPLRDRMQAVTTVEITARIPLKWIELTGEQDHLGTLGWTETAWDDLDTFEPPMSASTAWNSLSCAQQIAARGLGFWSHTWPVDAGSADPDTTATCSGLSAHWLDSVPEAALPSRLVSGCFWDRATMQSVTSRPVQSPTFGNSEHPRYSALCTLDLPIQASVVQELQVGLPGSTAATLVRSVSATMQTAGHPRTVQTAHAVIVGEYFDKDEEAVPYPKGQPLLVLHDPPGGASFSEFQNLQISSTITHKGRKVLQGATHALGAKSTVEPKLNPETGACVGVGVAVCNAFNYPGLEGKYNVNVGATFNSMTPGTARTPLCPLCPELFVPLGGVDGDVSQHIKDRNGDAIAGVTDSQKLDPTTELELSITYKTSADANSAGPAADMFLMPAGTIQLTSTHLVSVTESGDTCTLSRAPDSSMVIMWHLAGFYFISAGDIETRVLPQLSTDLFRKTCDYDSSPKCVHAASASASSADILACEAITSLGGSAGVDVTNATAIEAERSSCTSTLTSTPGCEYDDSQTGAAKQEACCPVYNATDSAPCVIDGTTVDSLKAYCTAYLGFSTGGAAYESCMEVVSDADFQIWVGAKQDWEDSLARNYDLLASVKSANSETDPGAALVELCDGTYAGAEEADDEHQCELPRALYDARSFSYGAQWHKGPHGLVSEPHWAYLCQDRTVTDCNIVSDRSWGIVKDTSLLGSTIGGLWEFALATHFFDHYTTGSVHFFATVHDRLSNLAPLSIKAQYIGALLISWKVGARNLIKMAEWYKEYKVALDHPCEWLVARKICPWTNLAPESLISRAKDLDGKADEALRSEYRDYNVLSFGGGGAALDYSSLLQDPFEPLSTEVTVKLPRKDPKRDNYDRGSTLSGGVGIDLTLNGLGGGLSAERAINSKKIETHTQVSIRDMAHIFKNYTIVSVTGNTHVRHIVCLVGVQVTSMADKSHAAFHLEDPDKGDYFVVQVFRDPY